jgi:glyoxylase-like metal-dependent hydrolase (beta-lactamase superfamily II)
MLSGYANLRAYPASLTFSDRLDLADDLMPLELSFLGRANTDGDLVVWAPKSKILVAGDIVVHPIPYASACYLKEWQAVLTRIRNFDFAQLVPGHGGIQKDREHLDKLIAVLGDVRAQVQPMVDRGMTLDAILQAVDRKALRSRFVAEEDGWGRFLINAVFIEDLIKNAYKEAKGEPIVQGAG